MSNIIIYFIYEHNNNKCLLIIIIIINFIFRQNINERKNHIMLNFYVYYTSYWLVLSKYENW